MQGFQWVFLLKARGGQDERCRSWDLEEGLADCRLCGMWELPKIRGTLFWGPYNKDPTI